MLIEYYKTHTDVKNPTRGHPSDAGLDVFFCPERGTDKFADAVIKPGHGAILATGLMFGVPHGYMLEVKNRSSVAAKKGLLVGACVIDSGYDGEVFINLHNVGTEEQVVKISDKIAQLVLIPVIPFRAIESGDGNLYDWYPITISDRGPGALGSTDE